MIYCLEIENFFSIRDLQVIDLRVGRSVPDQPGHFHLLEGSNDRVPYVIAFFGANGAGKSTVLRALNFIFAVIRWSFTWTPEKIFDFAPFGDEESPKRPTRLALSFTFPEPAALTHERSQDEPVPPSDCDYRYELVIASASPPSILSETLTYRRSDMKRFAKLLTREDMKVTAGKEFHIGPLEGIIGSVLRSNASVISTLAQLNHPIAKVFQATSSVVTSNIGIYKVENSDDAVIQFYQQKEVLDAFNRDVSRLDIGIKRLDIASTNSGLIATFEHEGLHAPIPSLLESHGTRQFFRIFPYLEWALRHGTVAIIDELDASIHPMILPELVGWFNDPIHNPKHAQLWMTCHTSSMLEDLLKQEIYFCEKDSQGRTSVYGLKDVKGVRLADNYYRKYLGGAYGAIPNIG